VLVQPETAERLSTEAESHADSEADDQPLVDVVVPVYNEEAQLASNVRRLRSYLDRDFPFAAIVTIVDNGSTDATPVIAANLSTELDGVRVLHLQNKGRGRALRAAWSMSEADVVVYTDVDLSTSLDALLPLVAPLLSGHSDLSIGSRLARGAHVVRGAKRELISRSYNMILRAALRNDFSDAQCGFKAARTDVVRRLLPLVDDESWFFDTELLVLAERSGMRIHEVPVDWVDDPDSRVNIAKTAAADLRGVARLIVHRRTVTGRLVADSEQVDTGHSKQAKLLERVVRFARVGFLSTLAYGVLFLCLRPTVGDYWGNALALGVCTVANVAAHRWLAMRDDPVLRGGLLLGGVAAFATSLLLTTTALLVASLVEGSGWMVSLLALLIASAVAAVIRFSVLRTLVFRARCSRQNPTSRTN